MTFLKYDDETISRSRLQTKIIHQWKGHEKESDLYRCKMIDIAQRIVFFTYSSNEITAIIPEIITSWIFLRVKERFLLSLIWITKSQSITYCDMVVNNIEIKERT